MAFKVRSAAPARHGVICQMDDGHELHATSIPGRGVEPAGAFTIEPVAGHDGIATLALAGELDMAATPVLREHVDAAAVQRALVLDLAGTTFMDSAMLRELLRANSVLARSDTRLVLVAVPPVVARLLDITRTASLFAIAVDRASALQALAR